MPSNAKQNSPNQEEIDLLHLFVKLGELLKKLIFGLINLLGSILVFLIRKWYYFAIAVIFTLVSAVILNQLSEPNYYSELILRSNATRNQPIMSSLNKLGRYATDKNYPELSKELNLSLEEASAIRDLGTYWYYDIGGDGIFDGIDKELRFLSDTNVVMIDSVFMVYSTTYDPSILEKLERSLVTYLEVNPFLKALNLQRLSDLEAQLIQTDYEIAKLDSLQRREYFTDPDQLRQKEGQIVFTTEKTVRVYHHDMFRLMRIKQNYEKDLNIYRNVVTIVEGFSIPVQSFNGITWYAKKLFWFYMGLAVFVSIIVTFRKKIWPT